MVGLLRELILRKGVRKLFVHLGMRKALLMQGLSHAAK